MTAYKLVDKSCFINVSARLDPIEGYRGEEGPPPKLLSSRGFRGFRGSRPPLHMNFWGKSYQKNENSKKSTEGT